MSGSDSVVLPSDVQKNVAKKIKQRGKNSIASSFTENHRVFVGYISTLLSLKMQWGQLTQKYT